MSSPAIQHTIQIRLGHLAGLLLAVAALTAGTTWFASDLGNSHVTATARPEVTASPSAASKAYVDNVLALTGKQRAAIYGNVSASEQHVKEIVALTGEVRAAMYGNLPLSTGTP